MDFDQTCINTILEKCKSLLDFADLDLNFKVTPALLNVQNMVHMRYILNQWMNFDQTCIDTLLEMWTKMIIFGDLNINFKVIIL